MSQGLTLDPTLLLVHNNFRVIFENINSIFFANNTVSIGKHLKQVPRKYIADAQSVAKKLHFENKFCLNEPKVESLVFRFRKLELSNILIKFLEVMVNNTFSFHLKIKSIFLWLEHTLNIEKKLSKYRNGFEVTKLCVGETVLLVLQQ